MQKEGKMKKISHRKLITSLQKDEVAGGWKIMPTKYCKFKISLFKI